MTRSAVFWFSSTNSTASDHWRWLGGNVDASTGWPSPLSIRSRQVEQSKCPFRFQ